MITSHPTITCIREENGYWWMYDDEHQGYYIGPYAGITQDGEMVTINQMKEIKKKETK